MGSRDIFALQQWEYWCERSVLTTIGSMHVQIVRRRVRRVWITVHSTGQIVVTASPRYSTLRLQQLIERHRPWIERQQLRYRQLPKIVLQCDELLYRGRVYRFVCRQRLGASVLIYPRRRIIASGVNLLDPVIGQQWYENEAARLVRRRAVQLASRYGFTFARVEIRNYSRAWGYCSSDGLITFDWRIVKVPPFVMDYLILHELVHTKIPHHGLRFWQRLESICPAYRRAVEWLNSYGRWV